LAGFPLKETFFTAVRAENYATWPGLTTTLILKHFPDLDETQKGHLKGQQKRVSAPVTIKVELLTANPPPPTIKKHYDIFVVLYELLDTIHTDQNWHIPNYVATRLLVHHGGHPSGRKLHLLQINEEPNQRQNDHGIPKDGQQDEALGTWVKTSLFGQQVFSSIQSMHCKEWDDPQASSSGLPPSQHHRTGYPNNQEPFCLHPQ
jgi:hypothetical protein